MSSHYQAIVVGAGPGGSASAIQLARSGHRVLMLDRSRFPRDKVCGDGISAKSMQTLRKLGIAQKLPAEQSLDSWGVIFGGPFGDQAAIPFKDPSAGDGPPGVVCARTDFDQVLFQEARRAGAEVLCEATVTGLVREGDAVAGVAYRLPDGSERRAWAPVVIGADGANSAVARELGLGTLHENHYMAGVRTYFEGVNGLHEKGLIELHFVEEAIPGYFWLFPMTGDRCNVGLAILSSEVKKRKLRMKEQLDLLVEHPRFRQRFAGARRLTPTRGWGLPVGSRPRPMAGDGWLLVGDAASLIDPFTGEGIANAMISGMKAADWAASAHKAGDYSAAFLSGYERQVLDELRDELRVSHLLQRLFRWKWLFNAVIRRAARSPELASTISCMFNDEDERRKLLTPGFYWRALTA